MPAPFATVYVPSTGQGAVTDQDGRYTLDVPRGKTEVEFSYLGYCTMKRQLTFNRSDFSYHNEKLLSANPAMPDKAREQLFQMTHKDPFDKLYGDKTNYSMKVLKKGKCKYVLKGLIEENGQVINVLVNDQSGEGDDKGLTTLYVLEDNWCILRYEFTSKLWH